MDISKHIISVVYRIHPSPANLPKLLNVRHPIDWSGEHNNHDVSTHDDDHRRGADESDVHHRIGPLSRHVFAKFDVVVPIAVAADDDDRANLRSSWTKSCCC